MQDYLLVCAGVFGSHQLQVGGPLLTNHLQVLHGCPSLRDSHQIVDGLWTGGMRDAAERLLCGQVSVSSFRVRH